MDLAPHLQYSLLAIALTALVALVVWCRMRWHRQPAYVYPLASVVKHVYSHGFQTYRWIIFMLQMIVFGGLILLTSRVKQLDPSSLVHVEGVDIILVMDVSGSMACSDDERTQLSRIEIAKQEAIRFIKRRVNDPIGLVIFGRESASRCPLTLDKHVLEEIVASLDIGVIDEKGTVLSTALLTALGRLRHAKAKSKIIILLTDGEPTAEDSSPRLAVELAQKLDVKIYTIGIGSESGGFMVHPQFGLIPAGATLNRPLLEKIAHATGGKFFEARKPNELRLIYDQIDRLERTNHDASLFAHYKDYVGPLVWLVVLALFIQLCITTLIRFML
ncbi:VWA domain-containing protein [Candidatus Babeliales bacterium]|nr:VWA domain-containing protein [Candidatus Babeliales bacterium]